MNINVLPIVSKLHNGDIVNEETKQLLKEIERISDIRFHMTDKSHLYEADLALILVQSGGSEGYFLEMEEDLKPPYYLLTYGTNNSLAASMEILSYLKSKNCEAEILHGSVNYISNRLNELSNKNPKEITRLGVVGKPSDWLIASDVNYSDVLKKLNVELIDIDMQEVINLYHKTTLGDYRKGFILDFEKKAVDDAMKLAKVLDRIKEKYQLSGLTIRCFDLLDTIKTTGCLSLALLNSEGAIGTCEGDIPAMLSMYLLNEIVGEPGFQANPSLIDIETNEMVLAHCTLPLNMVKSYITMTHYESGIGVAFRGHLEETDITVFKLSKDLTNYHVQEGVIISNLEEDNLCRTQIKVKLENTKYFLTNPYGNHHIIVLGKHKDDIIKYMSNR